MNNLNDLNKIGDLNESSLEDIINSPTYKEILNDDRLNNEIQKMINNENRNCWTSNLFRICWWPWKSSGTYWWLSRWIYLYHSYSS